MRCNYILGWLLLVCHLLLGQNVAEAKKNLPPVISIHDTTIARAEKKALLILPGLGDSKKGRKHQLAWFDQFEYDVFIPAYLDFDSYEGCIANLTQFYADQHLADYKGVYVFSYIVGSWSLNEFIARESPTNIKAIVYDRSPLQERAPRVVEDCIPRIGKWVSGELVGDFNGRPYVSLPDTTIQVGIIVESKATKLIKTFKKTTISYGPLQWAPITPFQSHHDLVYTWLNHDQMYVSFDVIGNAIISFFEHGTFPTDARRNPYEWDYFSRSRKE